MKLQPMSFDVFPGKVGVILRDGSSDLPDCCRPVAGFGMASGVVFLSEPLSAHFAFAALLIAAGIALVNLRR